MLMHDAHRLLIYPSIYGLFDTALSAIYPHDAGQCADEADTDWWQNK